MINIENISLRDIIRLRLTYAFKMRIYVVSLSYEAMQLCPELACYNNRNKKVIDIYDGLRNKIYKG